MSNRIFGLDFGTTNSLAALVVGNQVRALTNETDGRPHPSVVWYRGADTVVGREARRYMESTEGGLGQGFVRSPKMRLRRVGPVYIEGRAVEPDDIVSEVLSHVREEAAGRADQSYDITRAVMTIPIDFAGPQRRALRAAARKAGIAVHQFVHEPAAALYAHLRARPDFRRGLAELENRVVLVFDWGGGTLDLTTCRVLGGVVMQIASRGNNDIGGDRFDELLRNEIRDRHAKQYGISDIYAVEQPGVAAALLTQCEQAKIALSSDLKVTVLLKDYLRADGPARNLAVDITRSDLDGLAQRLVNFGLTEVDTLLELADLDRRDIALCIATGGMVNMPAIWNGLVERFGARVPLLPNRDRIIAEGAAWIAHDDLRLRLAKPIEILIADGSGPGAYLPIVDAGHLLPVENQIAKVDERRFFCVDPRDGKAVFQFAKPLKVGLLQPGDKRTTLCSLNLPIDQNARPFVERLECLVQIDHDYIARATLRSTGRDEAVAVEIHDLDFGLAMPIGLPDLPASGSGSDQDDNESSVSRKRNAETAMPNSSTNIQLRSNVSDINSLKRVPGDIVRTWQPNFLDKRNPEPTELQREEADYYLACSYCHRTIYEIRRDGRVDECYIDGCASTRVG